MKLYKTYYDESLEKVSYISFEAKDKYDFSNEPETNLYDSVCAHNIDEDITKSWVYTLNNDIRDGKTFIRRCKDCNIYFTLDKKEIDWFENNNLKPPKRCPACRKKNKQKT